MSNSKSIIIRIWSIVSLIVILFGLGPGVIAAPPGQSEGGLSNDVVVEGSDGQLDDTTVSQDDSCDLNITKTVAPAAALPGARRRTAPSRQNGR